MDSVTIPLMVMGGVFHVTEDIMDLIVFPAMPVVLTEFVIMESWEMVLVFLVTQDIMDETVFPVLSLVLMVFPVPKLLVVMAVVHNVNLYSLV